MLPKHQRLNLKKSFTFVAGGRKRETAHLKLFFRTGVNEFPLVGIALAKKSFSKAHDRNRAKRLTAAAIQLVYPDLIRNLNLVIMPKRGVLEVSSDEIGEELTGVKDLYSVD